MMTSGTGNLVVTSLRVRRIIATLAATITMGTLVNATSPETQGNVGLRCVPSRDTACSIEIPVDIKEVGQLQRAFDEGHQPWRRDPIGVAHVGIASALETGIRYEDLKVEHESDLEAVVTGKGESYRYKVYLRRMATTRSDKPGIWIPVRIEYGLD